MPMSPLVRSFVSHFGEMGSRWGINRTVGQIYALIFISQRALNADEIAEALPRLQNERIVLIHASARYSTRYMEQVLAERLSAADQARVIRDGDPLGTRTEREAHADYALAYTMAVELYPHRSERYARWAAGWAALATDEATVRALGCDPALREEIEG